VGIASPTEALLASKQVSFPLDNAILQWEEGYRALEAEGPDTAAYRALGRAVVAVEDELRRRLGSSFSIEELASMYRDQSDWALDVAMRALPDDSRLAETSTVVDAAFYLYMREAVNFAGGSMRAHD
jgi:hypothetical protein